MAWPMMEWVLGQYYADEFKQVDNVERSVIVYGMGEAALTPLMVELEEVFAGVKVFSLPSVDHPKYGAHIELGVKGDDAKQVEVAFEAMMGRLKGMPVELG